MNETIKTISSLNTIHGNFSEKEISNDDLKLILDSSIKTANASNRQSYSIVVVENKDTMKKLCGYTGSKLLLYCVDFNRNIDMADYLNHEYIPNRKVDFITGTVDAVLAAQTAAIAAKSLGIDNLFTNGIHRGEDPERVYRLLNLPSKYCFPLVALVLGYPDGELKSKKSRVKKGVIHFGKYSRLSESELEEVILDYDRNNNLTSVWKENNFEHYLDWFYEKWLGVGKRPEPEKFNKLLLRTGFFN